MVTRMIDLLKSKGITGFFTSLVSSTAQNDTSGEIGVSSLIDTWIVVREMEENEGQRRIRGLYIVKSRGMGHSSDVHKLILSDNGVDLEPMDSNVTASANQKKRVGKEVSVSAEKSEIINMKWEDGARSSSWRQCILTSLLALAAQLEL